MTARLKYISLPDDATLTFIPSEIPQISQEYAQQLDIPSPVDYYLTPQGFGVPTFSQQPVVDYARLWDGHQTAIYALPSIDVDQLDGMQIFEHLSSGHRLSYTNQDEIINRLNLFIQSDLGYDMYPSFGIDEHPSQTMDFPFSPAADIPRACFLALSGSEEDLQEYLNDQGITHFTGQHIAWLPIQAKFFYLSRFYGPPSLEPQVQALSNKLYTMSAGNGQVDWVIRRLPSYMELYNRQPEKFLTFMEHLIHQPANVEQSLGVAYLPRLYNSYYEYYALIFRDAKNVPKDYRRSLEDYTKYLAMLSDKEIFQRIGYIPDKYDYRKDFQEAYINLYTGENIILVNADLCTDDTRRDFINDEPYTGHVIGIGNIKHGFSCVSLDELLENIKANNGRLLNPRTTADLGIPGVERIEELYKSIYPADEPRLVRLTEYLNLAMAAQVESDAFIAAFERSLTPETRPIVIRIFYHLFYMGMYFRQWPGPGHVYPLIEGQTGTEASPGSDMDTFITTKVFEQSQALDQELSKLPSSVVQAFWKLPIKTIDYDKQIISTGRDIGSRYDEVILQPQDNDLSCLRVASSQFVATGAFYLARIFGESIPGYRLNQRIEHVQ